MASIGDVAIAWSRVAPRTIGIAKRLSLELVAFNDKFPYMFAFRDTLSRASGWDRVILQLPPGPALAGVLTARSFIKNFTLICDIHTGMILFRDIKQALLNSPFVKLLKKCDYVLAHNIDNAHVLRAIGVKNVSVIYDPLPDPVPGRRPSISVRKGEYLIIPAGWDTDEPFDYLISELGEDVQQTIGYQVIVTGNFARTKFGIKYSNLLRRIKGVLLTGFLSYEEYVWLLRNSVAVLGITKSDHMMLRAFWEAAAYSKPVIAPKTKVAVEIMGEYPYYYRTYVKGSLRRAVRELRNDPVKSVLRAAQLASRLRKLSEKSMRELREIIENS